MVEQFEFLMQYKWFEYSVMVIVLGRVVFKPTFTLLAKYVELSVEMEDDKKLAKIMDSKWYKLLAYAVDLASSIKLPKKKSK
jgi:hypothetical protein